MKFGSLFAGIGGMDLGLERAGMECAWQVEIDEFCRKVLAKHWPNVPKFNDVRECGKHNLESVDLIAGGFPCQDISRIGKKAGIKGDKSGLWSEFFRLICELRPPYIIVENVPDLLIRGIERVLGDLASCGYDAEWEVLPAAAFGAIHIRERVFLVGLDSNVTGGRFCPLGAIRPERHLGPDAVYSRISKGDWWETEPNVVRVANGVPSRMDRIRGLGNAVVPQVAEWIGKRMIEAEEKQRSFDLLCDSIE